MALPSLITGGIEGVSNYFAGQQLAKEAKKNRQFQERVYNEGVERLDPWVTAGNNALQEYLAGLGLAGNPDDFIARFQDSPEYRLNYDAAVEEGRRGIERNASATGQLNSGRTLMALQDRGQRTTNNFLNNHLARILGVSEAGRGAAAGTNSFSGAQAGQVGSAISAVGDANAAGILGVGNSFGNTLRDIVQQGYANPQSTSGYSSPDFRRMY